MKDLFISEIGMDLDICIEQLFKEKEITNYKKALELSRYTQVELENAAQKFYKAHLSQRNSEWHYDNRSECLSNYIYDKWFKKLTCAYQYYSTPDGEDKLLSFLHKYHITMDYADQIVTQYPINYSPFFIFRADVAKYHQNAEEKEIMSHNEELTTMRNLHVRYIKNDLSQKINCIKITNQFISKNILSSIGIQCTTIELKNEHKPEVLTNQPEGVSEEELKNLDDLGIIKEGTRVYGGEILVGKHRPTGKSYDNHYINSSTYLSDRIQGVIVKVNVKSQWNGDVLKKSTNVLISIYIDVQLPIVNGDVLIDANGDKALVCGIAEDDDVDIVANFPFDGHIVKRLTSARHPTDLYVRGSQMDEQSNQSRIKYSPFTRQPYGTGFERPVILDSTLIIKFIKSNYFNALQNIIAMGDFDIRRHAFDDTLKHDKIPNICNFYKIAEFLQIGKALGVNTQIYVDKEKRIPIAQIINSPQLKLNATPIIDKAIDEISDGQVTVPALLETSRTLSSSPNKGNLFDPAIFGEDSSSRSFVNMGHIESGVSYNNPLFPEIELNKILVYPRGYRRIIPFRDKFIEEKNASEVYRRFLFKSNLLKHLRQEENKSNLIIPLEIKSSQKYINFLFHGDCDAQYVGLFSDYYDRLKDFFTHMPIDYSLSIRACITDNSEENTCLIPWDVAHILFENKICTLLSDEFNIDNTDIFPLSSLMSFLNMPEDNTLYKTSFQPWMNEPWLKKQKVKKARNYYHENLYNGDLIRKVNILLKDEKVLILSQDANGEIIELTPQVSIDNKLNASIVVSPRNYIKLETKIDSPVIVVYNPLGYTQKGVISQSSINDFDQFIKILGSEKITKKMLPLLFTALIEKERKENVVDSLAFCLLTGRRLPSERDLVDDTPLCHTMDRIKDVFQN